MTKDSEGSVHHEFTSTVLSSMAPHDFETKQQIPDLELNEGDVGGKVFDCWSS